MAGAHAVSEASLVRPANVRHGGKQVSDGLEPNWRVIEVSKLQNEAGIAPANDPLFR